MYTLELGIEIIVLLFLGLIPNLFFVPYGLIFGIKAIIFFSQLRFIFGRRHWLQNHGILRSLFTDVFIPTGLLIFQLILYLLYLDFRVITGVYILLNLMVTINLFMFFSMYPKTFYYYLLNKKYEEYIKDYQFRLKIDLDKIYALIPAILIAHVAVIVMIIVNSKFIFLSVNTILELVGSLGIYYIPTLNYREQVINKRYYKLMEKLSSGEESEPMEFWRARWSLRG